MNCYDFQGLVMTDWGSCNERAGRPELCALAGNDLVMPGGSFDRARILHALEDGSLVAATLRRCACRVLRLMLGAAVPQSGMRRQKAGLCLGKEDEHEF